MSQAITLVIVDDHPVVRTGIRSMLVHEAFRVVAEAANGAEALTMVQLHQPDIVLMDLRMPVMDGIAATEKIKAHYPNTVVLMLTTYDSDRDLLMAAQKGAAGYMLKDIPREALHDALRRTMRGERLFSVDMLNQAHTTPLVETLTQREIDVLSLVAVGLTNKDIATQLHISEATVKTHLINIFSKLQVSDRTAAVTVAVQRGFIDL